MGLSCTNLTLKLTLVVRTPQFSSLSNEGGVALGVSMNSNSLSLPLRLVAFDIFAKSPSPKSQLELSAESQSHEGVLEQTWSKGRKRGENHCVLVPLPHRVPELSKSRCHRPRLKPANPVYGLQFKIDAALIRSNVLWVDDELIDWLL